MCLLWMGKQRLFCEERRGRVRAVRGVDSRARVGAIVGGVGGGWWLD